MGSAKNADGGAITDSWNLVNMREVYEIIRDAIEAGFRRTIFLWGHRGVGKSDVVRQSTEDAGAHLVNRRLSMLDPSDVRGVMMGEPGQKLARWLLNPDWFPETKGKRLVIFGDEFNHANDLIQKTAYEMAWDHSVGGTPFPEGTVVILAGNRESENANVTPLDKPMQRRAIHLYAKFDYQTFFDHAMKRGQFHPLVLGYLKERPDKAFAPIDADLEFYGEPLPASWEVVTDILRTYKRNVDKLIAGQIGVGEAIEFMAWCATAGQLTPLIDAIEGGEDKTADEMSQQFFVCQSLVERFRRNPKLATRILDYSIAIKTSFPEMGGVMIGGAYTANRDAIKASRSWKPAMATYARYIA